MNTDFCSDVRAPYAETALGGRSNGGVVMV
jgi:hypothetical protein